MLPEWVSQPVRPRAAHTRRASAVGRFLRENARFVEEAVFLERAARRPGWVQGLDARTKVISILGLLVGASFLHHVVSLWLLGVCALGAMLASRLSPRVVFHRALWLMPGVFLLAALPAMLNVFTPGRAVLVLHRAPELAITQQGLAGAGLFISRLAVSVLLAFTLTLTTPAQDLFRAAYTSATAPFVLVLTMMHRYLFLLLRTVEELHLARRARTISPAPAGEERRWVGSSIAFLFTRSRRLTEEVYQAMLARGYTGQPKALRETRFGWREAAWLLTCGLLIAGTLFLDRAILRSWVW